MFTFLNSCGLPFVKIYVKELDEMKRPKTYVLSLVFDYPNYYKINRFMNRKENHFMMEF